MYSIYCRLNLHVSASNRDVIKAARRKIKKRLRTTHSAREARHNFYRAMLQEHADARALYLDWRF